MWLENDDLRLDLTAEREDAELKALLNQMPEWYNLSEKTWYGAPMPDRMTFKVRHKGQTVGAAEIVNIRWYNHKGELRFWLVPQARGKGLATRALKMIMELAFNTLNFHRLEAEVYAFNTKAIRLMQKLGFQKEGVLREAKYFSGSYHDIWRFGILRQEFLNSQNTNQ